MNGPEMKPPRSLHSLPPEGAPASFGAARQETEMKLRMRVTCGDAIALGPGKIALLEALDTCGSITAAARELGMSYRRAWLLVEELNTHMREPAVETAQGARVAAAAGSRRRGARCCGFIAPSRRPRVSIAVPRSRSCWIISGLCGEPTRPTCFSA